MGDKREIANIFHWMPRFRMYFHVGPNKIDFRLNWWWWWFRPFSFNWFKLYFFFFFNFYHVFWFISWIYGSLNGIIYLITIVTSHNPIDFREYSVAFIENVSNLYVAIYNSFYYTDFTIKRINWTHDLLETFSNSKKEKIRIEKNFPKMAVERKS